MAAGAGRRAGHRRTHAVRYRRGQPPARAGRRFSTADAARVKEIERTTNHDVKAVEYFIKERLRDDAELGPALEFVHFACTCEDINNLSYALMLQRGARRRAAADARRAHRPLREMAHAHAALPMLSRTHGQTASPTTVGKELANVVARLQRQRDVLAALPMPGKINGAVGNYNAHVVAYPDVDWPAFSQRFVESLGLDCSPTPPRSNRTTASPNCATRSSASTPSASTCAATSGATSRSATSSRR